MLALLFASASVLIVIGGVGIALTGGVALFRRLPADWFDSFSLIYWLGFLLLILGFLCLAALTSPSGSDDLPESERDYRCYIEKEVE